MFDIMYQNWYSKNKTIGIIVKNTETPPLKILSVRFYRESNGNEPVKKWLKSLGKEGCKVIGEDIKTVQLGWPIGMPLVKNLGEGLWEVRSRFSNSIARVIFRMKNGEMVLLHGFIKKSHKTPKQDMELARVRANNLS